MHGHLDTRLTKATVQSQGGLIADDHGALTLQPLQPFLVRVPRCRWRAARRTRAVCARAALVEAVPTVRATVAAAAAGGCPWNETSKSSDLRTGW